MKHAHTPGPWSSNNGFNVTVKPGTVYLLENQSMSETKAGELKANARLIAAAPELVEALDLALDIINDWKPRTATKEALAEIESIERTLAKARGES